MIYLKADTAVEVLIGPAVAVGDGFTPVTTLVLTSADEAELIKYNGATTLTGAAITNVLAALTSAVDGYYSLEFTTGETDTEGPLWIVIQDDSLILPIKHEFMVVNANVYDSMFAAAGTDKLQTDVTEIVGGTVPTPATTGIPDVNVREWLDTAVTLSATTSKPEVDVNSISDDATAANNAELDYDGTGYAKANSTIGTTTTNTDMVGTNSAALASVCTEARLVELDGANLPTTTDDIKTETDKIAVADAGAGVTGSVIEEVENRTTPSDTQVANVTQWLGSAPDALSSGKVAADIKLWLATAPLPLVAQRVITDLRAINSSGGAATKLQKSADVIVSGTVDTTGFTPTTTQFEADDITEATADHFNGRIIIFTSGALISQATDITDYVLTGGRGQFTVTAMTEAPANNDTFVIV